MANSSELPTKLTVTGPEGTSSACEVVRVLSRGELAFVLLVRSAGELVVLKIARDGFERNLREEGRVLVRRAAGSKLVLRRGCTVEIGGRFAPALELSYLEGRSLLERLVDRALSSEEAATLLADVGGELLELAALGLRHGDVKPENIVLGEDGRFSLVDLGMVDLVADPVTRGTPRYLPPASELAKPLVRRTLDFYGLGRTLAEALLGDISVETGSLFASFGSALGEFRELLGILLAPRVEERGGADYVRHWLERNRPESEGERFEKERSRVRSAFLQVRFAELERLASFSRGSVSVPPDLRGSWIETAVELLRGLRVVFADPEEEKFEDDASYLEGTTLDRTRLLTLLLGTERVVSLAAYAENRNEESIVGALIRHLERAPLALFEVALGESSLPESLLEAQSRYLGGRLTARECQKTLEMARKEGSVEGLLLAARAFRTLGEPRAAALVLSNRAEAGPVFERALALERIGERAESEALLLRLTESGESKWCANATAQLARYSLDRGEVSNPFLARLSDVETTPRVLEVRILAALREGELDRALSFVDSADLLRVEPEERARLEVVSGMVFHARGVPELASERFRRAVETAERHLGPLERGTYLTSLGASLSDEGRLGEALGAIERACLHFEALGLFRELSYALLSRASIQEQLGSRREVAESVRWGTELARRTGDTRVEGYFWMCASDAEEGAPALRAAERARTLLSGYPLDRLRAEARLLRSGAPRGKETDDLVRAAGSVELSHEWWRARSERALAEEDVDSLRLALAELERVSAKRASARERTMSATVLEKGYRMLGMPREAVVSRQRGRQSADEYLRPLAPELRERIEQAAWMLPYLAPREDSGAIAEQMVEVEKLLRSFGRTEGFRPLLRQVIDALLLWAGGERGMLLLRAPGDRLSIRVARHFRRHDLSAGQLHLSRSLAKKAMLEAKPVVYFEHEGHKSDYGKSVTALALRAVLVVPLVARGEVVGVAYLDERSEADVFGEKSLGWASLIATVAGLAIREERDRLELERALGRARRARKKLHSELGNRERELHATKEELRAAKPEAALRGRYPMIVGRGPKMLSLLHLVERVAASDLSVLVVGESGTGKELVARAIADNSARKDKPFIAENCAAIPEPLLESTLFGHVKGAFTGAIRAKAGLFELANGGTLFLDEIGEMSLPMQSKLLRILQSGELRPVGAERSTIVDVRIVAATHRDLAELVRAGTFREDLYYRLTVVPVRIPALRERPEDIAPLVEHFSKLYGAGGQLPRTIRERLLRYSWPGNVRQLENEVRRLWVLGGASATLADLSPQILDSGRERAGATLHDKLDALSKRLVVESLAEHDGNRTKVAEALGLSRFGLQKMMDRLGISPDQNKAKPGRKRAVRLEEGG